MAWAACYAPPAGKPGADARRVPPRPPGQKLAATPIAEPLVIRALSRLPAAAFLCPMPTATAAFLYPGPLKGEIHDSRERFTPNRYDLSEIWEHLKAFGVRRSGKLQ